jgi:protein phosphatase
VRLGRAAGITDTGRRRLRNEDTFICEPPLFAVADGMGGARAGEVAAGLAATALEESGADVRGDAGLVSLIEEANRRIWERSLADPNTAGMGAVVTAAIVDAEAGIVTIGHVGDSRAYRIQGAAIDQLTTDHSLVAELVESGVLTPEEAEHHPQRSAITRALGTEPAVDVDTLTVEASPGDLFLICSDGLSIMLDDAQIADIVTSANGDLAAAAEALVAAANARGGEDNVTVVLFELVEGEAAPDSAAESGPDVHEAPDSGEESDSDEEPPQPEVAAAVANEDEAPAGPSLRRHGAGAGGRLAALVVILVVLALAVLVLYLGLSR